MKIYRTISVAIITATPQLVSAASTIHSESTISDLGTVVQKIFKLLIVFLPVVATIYLAISGYRYMVAQGNPDMVEKAKKSLTYAVFGVIVAYASVFLISMVGSEIGF